VDECRFGAEVFDSWLLPPPIAGGWLEGENGEDKSGPTLSKTESVGTQKSLKDLRLHHSPRTTGRLVDDARWCNMVYRGVE
jgi:hypothetical protein